MILRKLAFEKMDRAVSFQALEYLANSILDKKVQPMAWGKIITTKFYLNTNLQPISLGHRKELYPLYVRVICKQQVSQFKYFGKDLEPRLLTKEEFENTFGAIDFNSEDNQELKEKAYGVALYSSFKRDTEYLLTFLDAFDRVSFKIKKLPSVLKSYYELDREVLKLSTSSLIKEMQKHGFDSLIPIIDWRAQHPKGIETALLELQERFKLKQTRIDYSGLPFFHVQEVLNIIKQERSLTGSRENLVSQLMGQMKPKTLANYQELIHSILERGIDFYREAHKLTNR